MSDEKTAVEKLAVPIELIGDDENKEYLARIVNRAAKSELGKKTLEIAAEAGFTLDSAPVKLTAGICMPDTKYIGISSLLSEDLLVSALIHEARHAGQFARVTGDNVTRDNVKTQIMFIRAEEADAQAVACASAWEMKQEGDEKAFETFKKNNPEIAKPFEEAIEKGADISTATTEAFKGWYDNGPVKYQYEKHALVSRLTDITSRMQRSGELKYDRDLKGKDITDKLCFAKEGESYFKGDPEVLREGKFIDIELSTKNGLKRIMGFREKSSGLKPDASYESLPIRDNEYTDLYKNKSFKQKSSSSDRPVVVDTDKRQDEAKKRIEAAKERSAKRAALAAKKASMANAR